MAKLSLTKLRAALRPGTEFIAEFIGVNRKLCMPGNEKTRRRVLTNTANEMKSWLLDGPRQNEPIYLNWRFCSADQRDDGSIVLTNAESKPPEEFLLITFEK